MHLSFPQAGAAHAPLPRAIRVLVGVSMPMNVSCGMIPSWLPLLLVGSLGIRLFVVALVEGVSEVTALIVKVFSGVPSDHPRNLRRRKLLALPGHGLGALSKPAFALDQGAGRPRSASPTARPGDRPPRP